MSRFTVSDENLPVADRSVSRIINQRAILDRIFGGQGISKAELAKDLGISKPAVSNNVSELIAIGLVEEKGTSEASAKGGRRPVMLFLNPGHSYIGVVDLSHQIPVCAIFDLQSRLIGMKNIAVLDSDSGETRRQRITETLLQTLGEAGIPREKLGVAVISQPGMFSDDTGAEYISSHHYPWPELDLRPHLERGLGVPVVIKNDVNLAAVGQVHFGTGSKLRDLLYVSCGVGLGAGLIMGGELYEGSRGVSGEIGFMLLGNGSCLEENVAIDGLIALAGKRLAEAGRGEALSFPLIVEKLDKGDEILEEAVCDIGRELGRMIQNCCVLLDIPTVIFGGEYLKLGSALFRGMNEFAARSPHLHYELIPSTMANTASLYGGSVIGREKLFSILVGEI